MNRRILTLALIVLISGYYETLAQCQGNVLNATGNIGINTNTPDKKLSIGGNQNCSDVAIKLFYNLETPISAGIFALTTGGNFSLYSMVPQNPFAGRGDMLIAATESKNVIITTRDSEGKIKFATTEAFMGPDFERMTIVPLGNVGINEPNPTSRLQIRGISSSGYTSAFSVYNQSGSPIIYVTDDGKVGIGTSSASYTLQVDGTAKFADILIGDANDPNRTLDVNGYIIANAIKSHGTIIAEGTVCTKEVNIINTPCTWPDYVFKDDYDLQPLEELEKSIGVKGSLPGIPTETEIQKTGINVGEMQALLLKKVEELTLYVIQLDKENKKLQRQNRALDKKIRSIKSK